MEPLALVPRIEVAVACADRGQQLGVQLTLPRVGRRPEPAQLVLLEARGTLQRGAVAELDERRVRVGAELLVAGDDHARAEARRPGLDLPRHAAVDRRRLLLVAELAQRLPAGNAHAEPALRVGRALALAVH